MASKLTHLTRPIVRRIGKLVVRIAPEGLSIRGYQCRTWRRVSWLSVGSLLEAEEAPVLVRADQVTGARVLKRMGALPTEKPRKAKD